jgi:hypothetical protein
VLSLRDLVLCSAPLLISVGLQVRPQLRSAGDGKGLPGRAFLPKAPDPGGRLRGVAGESWIVVADPCRRGRPGR